MFRVESYYKNTWCCCTQLCAHFFERFLHVHRCKIWRQSENLKATLTRLTSPGDDEFSGNITATSVAISRQSTSRVALRRWSLMRSIVNYFLGVTISVLIFAFLCVLKKKKCIFCNYFYFSLYFTEFFICSWKQHLKHKEKIIKNKFF